MGHNGQVAWRVDCPVCGRRVLIRRDDELIRNHVPPGQVKGSGNCPGSSMAPQPCDNCYRDDCLECRLADRRRPAEVSDSVEQRLMARDRERERIAQLTFSVSP